MSLPTSALSIRGLEDLLAAVRDLSVRFVDVRYVTWSGRFEHVTYSARAFLEVASQGSIRLAESAVAGEPGHPDARVLRLDPRTARFDLFAEMPTLVVLAEFGREVPGAVVDGRNAVDLEVSALDGRGVAGRTERRVRDSGLLAEVSLQVTLEACVFDDVRYGSSVHSSSYVVESQTGAWNSAREEFPNLAYKATGVPGAATGRELPPWDQFADLRSEVASALEDAGVGVLQHAVGHAAPYRARWTLAPTSLQSAADGVATAKDLARQVARRRGRVLTFMPHPLWNEIGNRVSLRIGLRFNGQDHARGEAFTGTTPVAALQFMAGLVHHAEALTALGAPSTNSYRGGPVRLRPRISEEAGSSSRVEIVLEGADGAWHPYLYASAVVLAGLDGLRRERAYDPAATTDGVPSLEAALEALDRDREFLCEEGVFGSELIDRFLAHKREVELREVTGRPHPAEFSLYFDV